MNYMAKAWEVSQQVASFYAEEKYTDKDGLVWLGIEGDTRDEDHWLREDAQVSMSSADMTKKMINELMNWDETPVEDPYEYAVEWTVKGSDVPVPIQEVNWVQRGSAERVIEFNERMFPDKMQEYTVRLVKRRKAGRIEDV